MLRKGVVMALFVSFLAMASSGLLMFFIEKPSFSIQMHPVHKLFGLLMILAAIIHIVLNYRAIKKYVQSRIIALWAALLVVILVFLYGVAIRNQVPSNIALPMDSLAKQAELHD